jgi:hypothetical protein
MLAPRPQTPAGCFLPWKDRPTVSYPTRREDYTSLRANVSIRKSIQRGVGVRKEKRRGDLQKARPPLHTIRRRARRPQGVDSCAVSMREVRARSARVLRIRGAAVSGYDCARPRSRIGTRADPSHTAGKVLQAMRGAASARAAPPNGRRKPSMTASARRRGWLDAGSGMQNHRGGKTWGIQRPQRVTRARALQPRSVKTPGSC